MTFIFTRKPAAAGTFYSDNKTELINQIKYSFQSNLGPGKIPKGTHEKPLPIGAVVPHAGYSYSGPCAAHIYHLLANSETPDTIIILGPSHNDLGKVSVWMGSDWETTFGPVKVNKELAKTILNSSDIFDSEPMPHMQEHSIEVQLPFLQAIYGNKLKIIPIIITPKPSMNLCEQVGSALAQVIKLSKKKVLVLASSDFTHYGHSYGYLPFSGSNVRAEIEEADKKVIDEITDLNLEKYVEKVTKNQTICGQTAIGCLISYAKSMNASKGKLMKYYLSGDITGSYMNSVSYASILIE